MMGRLPDVVSKWRDILHHWVMVLSSMIFGVRALHMKFWTSYSRIPTSGTAFCKHHTEISSKVRSCGCQWSLVLLGQCKMINTFAIARFQCLRFIQAWIVFTHMPLLKSCFDSKVYRSLERRSWTDASEGYAATCHGLVVHQYASVLIPPKRVEISMKPTPLCWSWGNSPPQFQFISRQFISHTCAEMSSYYFEPSEK